MTPTSKKNALILCTGNSCRSQMAEGLWNQLGNESWSAQSAGSKPAGYVHPLAIQVMGELEIDIADHRSKSIDQMTDQDFDLVVTVCDSAKESCPTLAGAKQTLHWPFDDPADATGDEQTKLGEFRRVRDEIKARIQRFLTDNA